MDALCPKPRGAAALAVRAFAIAGLAALCLVAGPAAADDLSGRTLVRVDQAEDALALMVLRIGLDDEDKVSGEVASVTVEAANEREVTLNVAYRGYQGAELAFEVKDTDKRRIERIPEVRYAVPEADPDAVQAAVVKLALDDRTEEGFEARSSRLEMSIRKHGKRTVQHLFTWLLDKTWSHAISNENLVVRVTPRPIGETADWVRNITRPAEPAPAPRPVAVTPLRLDRPVLAALATPNTPTPTRRPAVTATPTARIATAETLRNENIALIQALPNRETMLAIRDYRFATAKPTSPTSTEASNQVANASVDLLSLLRFEDGVDFDASDILGIARHVYPDANPASGVFYYVPRAYRLSYDPNVGGGKGLGFRITYDRRREGQETPSVRMAASFDSAVDLREIRLAERILEALDRADASFQFKPPLKPFPLAAPPAFDFSGALAGHVDPERIAVVALSDTLEGIDVSWATDAIAAQNIRRDLRDGTPITGIAGFDPPGENAPRLVMPVRIDITDPDVYQAVAWSREGPIRNRSPLPIVLQYVHALVIEGNRPRLYSWTLDDTPLPPSSTLELDLGPIPEAVDGKAERVWLQYRLDRSCETCIDGVVDTLLSGDVWPDTGSITLRSLTPLEATGAAEIWVDVRSRFFDPSDRSVRPGPQTTIVADRASYQIDPVFLTSRLDPATGEAWPLFEYRLTLVMPDGSVHDGMHWLPSERDTVVIGPVQVEQSLGFLPGSGT